MLAACSEEARERDPGDTEAASGEGAGEPRQARAIPEKGGVVAPGRYSTGEQFEPPFSLQLGEGWRVLPGSGTHSLRLGYITPGSEVAEGKALRFLNVEEVFEPHEEGSGTSFEAKPAPGDLVAWFQRHQYLSAEEPEPVDIGGETGERFDALINVPEGYRDAHGSGCPIPCIPLLRLKDGSVTHATEKGKDRIIVLEGVQGERLVIIASAPVDEFDEFLSEAQAVLETVDWEDT